MEDCRLATTSIVDGVLQTLVATLGMLVVIMFVRKSIKMTIII